MADRSTWSYAPIPSTFRTVAVGVQVCCCPKLVLHAIRSRSGGGCILERRTLILKFLHELLRECPSHDTPQRGASGHAKLSAVLLRDGCQSCAHQHISDHLRDCRLCQAVRCFNQQFECVGVFQQQFQVLVSAPPLALAKTREVPTLHCNKIFRSNVTGSSGSNSNTACGIARDATCGRLLCISNSVASVPGATAAPVRHCRARDTSPNWIFCSAARAFSRLGSGRCCGLEPNLDACRQAASWSVLH